MRFFIFISCVIGFASNVAAGSLAEGTWHSTTCGEKPTNPAINSKSIEAYNESLNSLKVWEKSAQGYINCVVGEANADSKAIAKSANDEQEEFRKTVANINAATTAAKNKLDHQ